MGWGYVAATKVISSRTVTRGMALPSWSMAPTLPARTAVSGVPPNSRTVPASGGSRPSSMLRVVDFPAPLRPSSATVSPAAISSSSPSTARTAP